MGFAAGLVLIAAVFLYAGRLVTGKPGRVTERKVTGCPQDGKGCMSMGERAALDRMEALYKDTTAAGPGSKEGTEGEQ